MVTVAVEVAKKVGCVVCGKEKFAFKSPYVCHSCWVSGEAALMIQRLTQDAQDGVTGAATLSGLYNCNVCGQEKCVEPGICDDCLAPPTEFEINQWRDGEATPPVI